MKKEHMQAVLAVTTPKNYGIMKEFIKFAHEPPSEADTKEMTKAFSYIRFSTIAQADSTSLARQTATAVRYAQEHGLELDNLTYRDLGISAFRGKNATEGKLKAFTDAVDSGVIPVGSYLLVESLDRLSRNQIDIALELFLSLLRRGIVIVTLVDNQTYSAESVRNNWTQLIISLATMARAHEESAIKSTRSKAAVAITKSQGKKFAKAPFWLKVNADRKSFTILPDQVEIVRAVFKMRLEGIGSLRIAQWLNTTHGWNWGSPQVARLLQNPAVVGTLTSQAGYEPMLGYYPPVIDASDYYTVQEAIARGPALRGGRRPEDEPNLFTGLVRCAKCGGRLRFQRATANVSQRYFACSNTLNKVKGCDAKHVNYDAFEKEMVAALLMDQDEEVIRIFDLNPTNKRSEYEGELKMLKEQQGRLLELVMSGTLSDTTASSIKLNEISTKMKAVEALMLKEAPTGQDRLPAERAWSLAVEHQDRALDDDLTRFYQIRRDIRMAFQRSIETLFVHPEDRKDDQINVMVDVKLIGKDEQLVVKYTRPALRHVKGVYNTKKASVPR